MLRSLKLRMMPDARERAMRLRSRSTPETATRVRTLTAIADGERSGALGHSASLPQLDVGRRGQGHHTRLLTPAFERIDLALPPVSLERSRSLSALAGMANARQQRVQIELDRVVKRRNEGEQPDGRLEDGEGEPRHAQVDEDIALGNLGDRGEGLRGEGGRLRAQA